MSANSAGPDTRSKTGRPPLAREPRPAPEGSGQPPGTIRFVFRQLARFRGPFVAAMIWSVLFVIVPMQVPLLAGMLVSGLLGQPAAFYGVWTLTSPTQVFWFAVFGFVVVAGAYGATAYLSSSSTAELGRTFVREQQKELIGKLDSSPIALHQRYGSGELLSRVVTDTASTRNFVTQVFFNTVQSAVRVAYPVAVLFLLDPWVAVVAVAILPAEWAISSRLQAGLRTATRTARSTKGRLTAAVQENLDGIEAIQTSQAEVTATDRVGREADQLARDEIRVRTYFGLINGVTWTLTSIGIAAAWAVGGWQVLQGALSVGVLVAVAGYVALLYLPMRQFTSVANTYQSGLVAFERIREVLEAPSPIEDDASAPPLRVGFGRIEFRDVSFGYGTTRSLDHVNLTFRPGRLTVLVGRNGSGKSTVLKLISRLYDPDEGTVLLDGQDVKQVRLRSLRSQVAVVPQAATIFTGTVAENLRWGRVDAPEGDVRWAASVTGADRFIEQLPQGYATRLGPGGIRLSGGQAQRLVIARALVRRPRILLLDEPNSALDPESERRLWAVLTRLKGAVTVILVAHHLDAVMGSADDIIVMEAGRIVEPRRLLAAVPPARRPADPPRPVRGYQV